MMIVTWKGFQIMVYMSLWVVDHKLRSHRLHLDLENMIEMIQTITVPPNNIQQWKAVCQGCLIWVEIFNLLDQVSIMLLIVWAKIKSLLFLLAMLSALMDQRTKVSWDQVPITVNQLNMVQAIQWVKFLEKRIKILIQGQEIMKSIIKLLRML